MKKIIGVDLDEVLSETLNVLLKYNNYMFNGIPIRKKDVLDYVIQNIPKYKADNEYTRGWFNTYLASKESKLKPVMGAKRKLMEFKKKGYTLFVVTARPDELREASWKWLNKHFAGLFDEVIFANHFTEKSKEKSDICKEAGIKIMIEDNLHYAVKLAQKGIKVYLLDKPWNKWYDPKIHKGIIKVKGWKEIEL